MFRKKLIATVIGLLLVLLAACAGPPFWTIASQGDSCTPATVLEKRWSDNDWSDFYILLKAEDGEIGIADVNEYVYESLDVGEETCVNR